jgi:threonine dehydratase
VKAGKVSTSSGPVATILSGRNVDMAVFTDVVSGRGVTLGDVRLEGRAYAA